MITRINDIEWNCEAEHDDFAKVWLELYGVYIKYLERATKSGKVYNIPMPEWIALQLKYAASGGKDKCIGVV